MSIINKMHHDFRESQQDGPVLVGIPERSRSTKVIIAVVIVLLILSAIGFATLIFNQRAHTSEQSTVVHKDNQLDVNHLVVKTSKSLHPIVEQSDVKTDSVDIVKETVVTEIVSKPSIALVSAMVSPEKQQPVLKTVIDNVSPIKIEQM